MPPTKMNLVQVLERATGVYVLWFEAHSVYMVNSKLFFADGKKYQTAMEVYIEIINDDNETIKTLGNRSGALPQPEVQPN